MSKSLLAAIVTALLTTVAARAGTIEMKVYGLVCAFCAQGIEKTFRSKPATADVLVSLEKKLVAVAVREGHDISDAELTKTLSDAGYDVRAISRTDRSLAQIRDSLKRSKK
jgi:copper chaperone CopZ